MIGGADRVAGSKRDPRLVAFGVKFLLIFALLFAGYEAARGSPIEEFLMRSLVLAPTAALVNWIGPTPDVRVEGRNLISPGANLHITRGCEGVEMLMLLAAGILAFPSTAGHRVRGFILGLALVYVLTLTRLALLHVTLRYSPAAWDALHGVVLPLGPVLIIAWYFLMWSAPAATRPMPDRGAAA